ncbi:MAG: RNA polymerase sigma factor [Candidatus Aminicenantaceae bacterium]
MDQESKDSWKEFFTEFYQKYSRPFWLYIFKICGDENLAEDIFQESFLRFLKAEPVIVSVIHLRSYLYKIAFRLIIDKKRKIKVENRVFEDRKKALKENLYTESRENRTHISEEMEKTFQLLKPKERILLWLAYVEGYSYKEIGEITKCKENSVKVKVFNARKKFAGLLREKRQEKGEKIWEKGFVI